MAALGVALIAWRSNGLLLTCMAFGLQLMLTGTSAFIPGLEEGGGAGIADFGAVDREHGGYSGLKNMGWL